MDKIEKLKSLVESAEQDAIKFYEKKNKSAGVRLRKTLMEIKTLCHETRADVTKEKNAE